MTKDRALQVLHVYASVNGSGQCTQDEFEEAKKMAIKALEAKDNNVPSKDTIYRAAAIDVVRNRVKKYTTPCVLAVTDIQQLPSVQPELIEKSAYIRGFEQGRTQGMIDAQGGKK